MGLLEGQSALVTGGGSGIGAATCRRMAEEGAKVAVFDRDPESAHRVAGEIGGFAFAADVSDHAQMRRTVADAVAELGGLSVVFANAGIGSFGAVGRDGHRRVAQGDRCQSVGGLPHRTRVSSPPGEKRFGSIVCTASISGVRPAEGEAAYAASKAGVAAFCASVALEYGPAVRCNAVSPGMIATALTAPLTDNFPDLVARMVDKTPAGRVGAPEDIADVVVFLCSDLARFVTGQNLVVDGGMTLHGSGVDGLYRYFKPGGRIQDL